MKKYFFLYFNIFFLIVPSVYAQKQITLESIYKEYRFIPKMVEGIRSLQDGENYTILDQFFYVNKFNYEKGDFIETVFSVNDLKNPPFQFIDDYEFSSDETKLLITTAKEPVFRHSFKANYFVFDLITKRLIPLSDSGPQQLATFSPDGTRIAFVRDNNIFIMDIKSRSESPATIDGEWNKIINGAPDWVYEEEFGFSKAFAWSSDSRKIAFCKFDESRVKEYNLTLFTDLYPQWYKYKYPKAGESNSIVSVHVFDLESGETMKMDIGKETDQYIPRIKWIRDSGMLSIIRLNRRQNKLEVLHAQSTTGISSVIYEEESNYYISEVDDNKITYLQNSDEFIVTSEKSGWKHLHKYNFINKESAPITTGNFDIGEILLIDEQKEIIYYSSHEESTLRKDVYSINFNGTIKKKLTKRNGWNDAQFSRNGKYFILNNSDANTPYSYSLHNSDGKLIRNIENNSELVRIRKNYGFQKKEFFNFKTSYNDYLNGFMIKPSDFDKNKKYPVLMFVYGGPESQSVTDLFSSRDNWFHMLAQIGYLVVCVDNRGTDNRGEEFRKSTYLQLGKLETEDQIEAARYLSSLSYVEATRIGIFGWSYGGYMSLLCLSKGADIFKMAIAVAPVTNWRFYDTIYTERFMRTPQENPGGYDDNSPINHVEKIQGNLLLVHGMADDNVHMQNSTELVDKLVEAGKKFEMMFYPNKNHGIYGGNTSYHLYSKMTDFILENL